jgi:hypothetical protein
MLEEPWDMLDDPDLCNLNSQTKQFQSNENFNFMPFYNDK